MTKIFMAVLIVVLVIGFIQVVAALIPFIIIAFGVIWFFARLTE